VLARRQVDLGGGGAICPQLHDLGRKERVQLDGVGPESGLVAGLRLSHEPDGAVARCADVVRVYGRLGHLEGHAERIARSLGVARCSRAETRIGLPGAPDPADSCCECDGLAL
jgi:hypothetical protein